MFGRRDDMYWMVAAFFVILTISGALRMPFWLPWVFVWLIIPRNANDDDLPLAETRKRKMMQTPTVEQTEHEYVHTVDGETLEVLDADDDRQHRGLL